MQQYYAIAANRYKHNADDFPVLRELIWLLYNEYADDELEETYIIRYSVQFNDSGVLTYLSEILVYKRDYERAREYAERASVANNNSVRPRISIGEQMIMQNASQEAAELLRPLCEQPRLKHSELYEAGRLLLIANETESAMRCLGRTLKLAKELGDRFYFEDASSEFLKAVRLRDDLPDSHVRGALEEIAGSATDEGLRQEAPELLRSVSKSQKI